METAPSSQTFQYGKPGNELLDEVIKAHGGIERWNRIHSIDLRENFSGGLLALKGYPGKYQPTFTVDAQKPRCVIQRLGTANPDDRWHLDGDRTWIERRDGSIAKNRDNTRASFKGHIRSTPWDELQLTYFAAYAHWNYLCAPFIFTWPGFSTREIESHAEAGQIWRVLEVTHPDGFPTHTKIQKFYFDSEKFLLRRLDYVTDVAAGVVAHYCYDHKNIDGIVFPTFRRVVWREQDDSAVIHGPSSFILDYVSLVINDKEQIGSSTV
jgi:hypothetical protein